MKYSRLILILVVLFGCKKESQLETLEQRVSGTWELKNASPIILQSYSVEEPDLDIHANMFTNANCYQGSILRLDKNGKFEMDPGLFISNNQLLNTQKALNGTWRIIDSSLIIYNGPNSSGTNYKITRLTENELTLEKIYRLCVFTTDSTVEITNVPYVFEFMK